MAAADPTDRDGVRLGKEQRKDLLAELERQSSRSDTPERVLQRGEQALNSGQLDQARRVLRYLESSQPELAGLEGFRQAVESAVNKEQHQNNLRMTEEMLIRYIQQRKKPLAAMALETLLELSTNHPRRSDYERWVADLDQEVALQRRIDERFEAGRSAARSGDLKTAEKHLEALHKVDPDSALTEQLAAEIANIEQDQALTAGIDEAKRLLEQHLAEDRLTEAEQQMERLSRMDIPKVTIDFYRQRVEDARRRLNDDAEAQSLLSVFHLHVDSRDWPNAREVVQHFGKRFPDSPQTAELFAQINELEAAERRQQSIREGVTALEGFIAEGKRPEAEIALKLLRRLELEPTLLSQLEAQVNDL